MSLFQRLIVLVLVAMAPAAGIQLYNIDNLRQQREAEVQEQALSLRDLVKAEQVQLLEGVRQTLSLLRQTFVVRNNAATAACNQLMQRLKADTPAYLDLYVTGPEGVIRCTTEPPAIGVSIAERSHVRRALQTGDFAIGEYVANLPNGKGTFPVALPYHDTSDQIGGVVSALIDVDWLNALVRAKPLPAEAAVTVADRNGITLIQVPQRASGVGHLLPNAYQPLLSGAQDGVAVVNTPDGHPHIVAYSPVGAAGNAAHDALFVAVDFDLATVTDPLDHAFRRSLVLFALGIALLLIVSGVGGQILLRQPVHALVAATHRWRAGDLGARSGVTTGAELGDLARAFDALVTDLDRQTEQRQRAERAQRASEARYRAIVDTAVDALVVIDQTGTIQSFNQAAERIFGYTAAEAIGRNVRLLMPQTDAAGHDGHLERYARTGERKIIGIGRRVDGRHRDGSLIPLELSIAEWQVDGQRFFTGIMRDVAHRLEAERRLRENLALLDTIIESSPDPIFVKDRTGAFLLVNSATALVFGRLRAHVTGALERDLMPPDVAASFQRNDAQVMASGHAQTFEDRVFSVGHSAARHFLTTKTPLRDHVGRIVGIIGIARDITDLKRTDMALRASEERYRGLVEMQSDIVVRFDADHRFTFINDTGCQVFGRRREDLIDTPWHAFVEPDDAALVAASVAQAIASPGQRVRVEARMRTVDGLRWYAWEGSVIAVDAPGEAHEVQAVGRDVTRRKAMEDDLRVVKEEAERANLAKSKFLAAASHDLRQPLQSLFLFSAALAAHLPQGRGRDILAMLERGLDTLKALLDSLLDVSRLDAGVIVPEVTVVDLAALVEDIAEASRAVAVSKGLTFITPTSGILPVQTDPLLLGRMIRNLVENALRYTERGGIEIAWTVSGRYVHLEIKDTGIGIPSEHLNRIFEEFHQVNNVGRDRSEGLGLGLAIVQRLSTLLNHPVQVRSELGNGSVFSIAVPLSPDAAAPRASCAPAVITGQNLLAVVIDDDALVLMGLSAVLEGKGFTAVTAGSGDEALDRVRDLARPPDIIIADYRLRDGETGIAAVLRLRRALGGAVPGILLTGETGPSFQSEAAAHALGVAHKPVASDQLFRAMEDQLRAARSGASA